MLTSERQRLIKEQAMELGEVSITELAQKYNVSVETIRRDINILSNKNLLQKVHGGAVPIRSSVREDAYDVRHLKNHEAKAAIGEFIAANLINNNDNIVISDGSTMEVLASSVKDRHGLMIVTNSFKVATILQDRIDRNIFSGRVLMLCGSVQPDEFCTCGSLAVEMIKKFTFNKAFIGASAVSGRDVMTSGVESGTILSAMIEHSQFCCVAADSAKFDIRSTYTFADLSEIDAVVTEKGDAISDDMLALFRVCNTKFYSADSISR